MAGHGPCNTYTGAYRLTGEGLTIAQLAGTMMMCGQPRMDQELEFLDLLAAVSRFELAADGSLVLHAHDDRTLRARRHQP